MSSPRVYTALRRVLSYLRCFVVPWCPEGVPKSDLDSHLLVAERSRIEPLARSCTHILRVFDVVYSGCKGISDCTELTKRLALFNINGLIMHTFCFLL
jgi:hypothetical protein